MRMTALRLTLFMLVLGAVSAVPVLAGSAVIGSVAGSMNATIGGQSLLPNTTIFSGDSLQVRDGVAVIAVGNSGRVICGRDTVASFLKEADRITVVLTQGGVSMLHPTDGAPVRVKAGDISITPASGFKTLGEVAMLDGSIVVTAKEGSLQVDNHGSTRNVAKGQTIVLSPRTNDNKGAGNAGWGSGGNLALDVAILGAAGTGAILAGVAMSRAGSAQSAANQAINAANAATTAANAANSTATSAVSAATAANSNATLAAFLAACTLDWLETNGGLASANAIGNGSQCPTFQINGTTPTP